MYTLIDCNMSVVIAATDSIIAAIVIAANLNANTTLVLAVNNKTVAVYSDSYFKLV